MFSPVDLPAQDIQTQAIEALNNGTLRVIHFEKLPDNYRLPQPEIIDEHQLLSSNYLESKNALESILEGKEEIKPVKTYIKRGRKSKK